MSPILVRPVREQFEHDRVIRLLQARYKRKFDVVMNPGAEQNASVLIGELAMYPDLVLFGQERSRRLQGTIEVETGESVNTLEALSQWGPFSRLRAPFFLYVPPHALDTARRLCTEHHVVVSELWTYHTAADQVRFTMVQRAPDAPQPRVKAEPAPKAAKAERTAATRPAKVAKTAKPAKSAKATKAAPAKRAQPRKAAKPAKAAKKPAKTSRRR